MNLQKHMTAKRAWGELKSERDKFVSLYVASQWLLLKAGCLTKGEVLENLHNNGIDQREIERIRNRGTLLEA